MWYTQINSTTFNKEKIMINKNHADAKAYIGLMIGFIGAFVLAVLTMNYGQ
jgi:F0F1-type ATP synthase membrane subunit a